MKPPTIWDAGDAIFHTRFFLENTLRNGIFPAYLAKHLGITRLDAELTLRLLVEYGQAIRRSDGRYFRKSCMEKYS